MNSDQSLSGFWLSKSSNGNSKKRINLLLWAPLSTPDWTLFWLDWGLLTTVGCSVQSETNAIVSNHISSSPAKLLFSETHLYFCTLHRRKLRAAMNQKENKRKIMSLDRHGCFASFLTPLQQQCYQRVDLMDRKVERTSQMSPVRVLKWWHSCASKD